MKVLAEINSNHNGAGDSSRLKVHVGVLGLQGDYQKHLEMLQSIDGVKATIVRTVAQIELCDGLIIPGGESTTVGKLMVRYGIDEAIKRRVEEGMTVFGTCAGMILLASDIEGSDQHRLGLMNISVRRNAFGRQVDSFEADLSLPAIDGAPVRLVFIRAPYITQVRGNVEVLGRLDDGEIIFVREGNCLAAAFHSELTEDTRVHEYFVQMTRTARSEVTRN